MNIFTLDTDPTIAAMYHCDKHCIKMILEHCQLMSTTHHILGTESDMLLKKTHVNHPCAIWTRQSTGNYKWLHELTVALCKEYTHRYGKVHAYERNGLLAFLASPPTNIKNGPMTPFAQAMPDKYHNNDAIIAYRNYYNGDKQRMLQYKNRSIPQWIKLEAIYESDYDS